MKHHLSIEAKSEILHPLSKSQWFSIEFSDPELVLLPSGRFHASSVLLVTCFGCDLGSGGVFFITIFGSGVDVPVSSALCSVYAMSILAWNVRGLENADTEKLGGNPFVPFQAKWYYDFLDDLGTVELAIKGGSFTWSNQRCTKNVILKKLDRVLSIGEWNLIFPKAVSVMDATISFDHAPIILLLSGSGMKISSLNPNGLLRKIALAMSRKLGSLSSSP
ncbi:hypothetical protein V6N11_069093 [Hibiscus sabdariffa]|uniref:Uncharacterized protein n=1 Tax=Hibiscus sabdariffa TaxID=183260 RepID=A0ABR2A5P8_9ROSI